MTHVMHTSSIEILASGTTQRAIWPGIFRASRARALSFELRERFLHPIEIKPSANAFVLGIKHGIRVQACLVIGPWFPQTPQSHFRSHLSHELLALPSLLLSYLTALRWKGSGSRPSIGSFALAYASPLGWVGGQLEGKRHTGTIGCEDCIRPVFGRFESNLYHYD